MPLQRPNATMVGLGGWRPARRRDEPLPQMDNQPHQDVTMLLQAVADGDSHASGELLPLVYAELQKLARSFMSREASGNTLQPTALVHEAYLRLIGDQDVAWDNRGHFFAAAAMAMRRILVQRARAKSRLKRGGSAGRVEFIEQSLVAEPPSEDMLSLDEALQRLEQYDPQVQDRDVALLCRPEH